MDELLKGLNDKQIEAVKTTEGPLLILAGAGSGKTRVITNRIAYIIGHRLATPEEILAVTFTNKAAGEMKERVFDLLSDIKSSNRYITHLGTFHSICVKVLRRDGHLIGVPPNFVIYDTGDQIDLIREIMRNLSIDTKQFNPRAVLSYISDAKNKLVDENAYGRHFNGYFQEMVAGIYPIYQDRLRANKAADFDDLINLTIDLLKSQPSIKEKYNKLFKYILIDEYQDTNYAQYVLIKYLVNEDLNNICVVGDEDQSIYKFRGATIDNILNFENDYPNAKVVKLEQNYRSTKNILEAAYQVIKINTERKEKKLWTENGEGSKVTIYTAIDENDEGFFIAGKVIELEKKEEVAVLYRTNGQSRSLEEVFLKFKIPYKLVGGTRFYDRKEIKDILAYTKLIYNIDDNLSLKRIINVPSRKIGAKTVKDIETKANENDMSIAEYLIKNRSTLSGNLNRFGEMLENMLEAKQEMNVFDLISFILKRSGYLDYLNDGTEEGESRIENIQELLTVAINYQDLEPENSLQNFLEDVSLIEQEQEAEQSLSESANVTLMTIHASKGLEFDHVFVAGMEESLFPHSRSFMDPSEMEEERRLAYVAITRAKKALYLTHANQRTIWGRPMQNPASRFLLDIPEELIEKEGDDLTSGWLKKSSVEKEDDFSIDVKPGDKVFHEIFKTGRVISVDTDVIIINFAPPVGIKKLSPEFAKITKI